MGEQDEVCCSRNLEHAIESDTQVSGTKCGAVSLFHHYKPVPARYMWKMNTKQIYRTMRTRFPALFSIFYGTVYVVLCYLAQYCFLFTEAFVTCNTQFHYVLIVISLSLRPTSSTIQS